MGFFSIREGLAGVAIAALLTTPATAAPSPLVGRACLANIVSDLSCSDSSTVARCIATEKVDAEILATCLEAAGCTEDEAGKAAWITEKCQMAASTSSSSSSSIENTQPPADLAGELRRRFHARSSNNNNNNNKRQDSTPTGEETTAATAASASSETSETSASSSASTSASSSTASTTSATSPTSTSSSASATSTGSSSSGINMGVSSAIVGSVLGIAAALTLGGVLIFAWRDGAASRKAKRDAAQKEALMSNIG